jgi:AraC-like DNA-binding protein
MKTDTVSLNEEQWRKVLNQLVAQDRELAHTLFSQFLQQLAVENEPAKPATLDEKRLQKVSEYVHRHYSEKIELQKIASHIGMAESTFCRFFKKTTGENFTGYVIKIRIEHAVRLLLETRESVADIGFKCGFATPHYFIHIFKEVKGCTPGSFAIRSHSSSEI